MDITSPSDLIAILENKVGSYIKVRVLKDSREAEIKIPVLAVNA
ncbi:hypothetical protein DJ523_07015 [Sulfolobus sp. E5]|nr:hypothetical protein DJ523_07015 [Sulfolobus sp. E5]